MAYLENLGLSGDMESFSNRKRIQKIVYLLRQFGADLDFSYNWYIHGPYSPELTKVLFNPSDDNQGETRVSITKSELQVINNARNFLGQDFYSVDSLELIVSLIYLLRNGAENRIDSKEKIIVYLREKKPHFTTEQVEDAWTKIEKSGNWAADLAKLNAS